MCIHPNPTPVHIFVDNLACFNIKLNFEKFIFSETSDFLKIFSINRRFADIFVSHLEIVLIYSINFSFSLKIPLFSRVSLLHVTRFFRTVGLTRSEASKTRKPEYC